MRNHASGTGVRGNKMCDRKAILKGTITSFTSDELCAVVKTIFGNALLDVNNTIDYRLKIGDQIEVEEADWYVANGHVVTMIGNRYLLNGNLHTIEEGQ